MNKKKRNKIIISIITIIIVCYLAYTIYLLIKQPTDIFTVEEGQVSMEETDIGYIIRDEQVVKGENYKNGMEQIITEGKKAAKGEAIFRYYSKNEESLIKQIADLDEKIQEVMTAQTNLYSSDIKLIENQIDEKVKELNSTTDITKLAEYKKEINELVTKKANIIGEKSPSGSYLKQLQDQRTSLENELNLNVYVDNDVRFNIKINDDNVMLIRDGADFINTFIFDKNKKNSISNYLIKENNCDVDIDIDVIDLKIDDDIIYIKYLISETNCIYEYKLEMRDVL